MTDISTSSVFSSLSIQQKNEEQNSSSNELGQNAFLKLMITQLENQSPLDPKNNTEFISQLAQFSSVEGLDRLNNNFDAFTNNFVANQALQASSLVGRSVSVPSETTRLDSMGIVSLSTDIPASTGSVAVNIYSESGELVEQMALGPQPSGEMVLRWDGWGAELNGEVLDWRSSHEEGLPPGNYRFEVLSQVDGEETALDTFLSANVNSVTVGATGALVLNLAGIGAVDLADVRQFNE
jgi:flagellar basal-body rod modification protein FlgD